MAVNNPSGLILNTQQTGIPYTKVTDSSADWASISNNTYFYDKNDKLVHYKDSSGNILELFSSASSGSTQSDLIIQQKISGITSNSLLTTISSGYSINTIVISENSGNDAGNISIGTIALGYDVVYNEPITANLEEKVGIGSDFFSLTNSQLLYISSSNWGSSSVTTYLILNKIIS